MKTTKLLIFSAAVCCMALFNAGAAGAIECKRPPLPEALDALKSSFSVDVSTVTVTSWDNSTPAPADDNIYYVFKPKRRVAKDRLHHTAGGQLRSPVLCPCCSCHCGKGIFDLHYSHAVLYCNIRLYAGRQNNSRPCAD